MSKRSAEDEGSLDTLKSGQRPDSNQNGEHSIDYEDPYEDEFDSEDEVMEAGVDGRPDAEREAEESRDAMDIDSKRTDVHTWALNTTARHVSDT